MSLVFFLVLQYEFDKFHYLTRLLALSMLAVQLRHSCILLDVVAFHLFRVEAHWANQRTLYSNPVQVALFAVMCSDKAKISGEDTSRYIRWNFVLRYCLPGFAFHLLFMDT